MLQFMGLQRVGHDCATDSFVTLWTVAPPGSSVHGIPQARIMEWVAIPFTRGSSQIKDQVQDHVCVCSVCIYISSVAQSCPTLCDPMNRSTPGLPVHHHLPESLRLTSIKSMMPSSHLILGRHLLLLPPIPPSITVFSNESTLRMNWPKYWSFSFSIIPSKEI